MNFILWYIFIGGVFLWIMQRMSSGPFTLGQQVLIVLVWPVILFVGMIDAAN